MNITRRKISFAIAGAIAGIAAAPGIFAQSWPQRPITIVAAYPPGGVADVIARVLATELAKRVGQPVVVENRVGGSGTIGAAYVAKAPPDGHTLLMGAMAEIVFTPFTMDNMQYQPDKHFVPVAMAVRYPFMLVANPAFPARNAAEMLALVRKEPGKHTYASSGVGSVQHIAMEMLIQQTGIKLHHIPYKGVSPMLTDILGNQVSMGVAGFPPAIVHVEAGKLTALGVTSRQRLKTHPNIPALAETPGLEAYDFPAWVGLFAPAGTPQPVIDRLHRESVAIFSVPEVRANLEKQAMTVSSESSAEFAAFVKNETRKYEKVIKDGGIKGAE